MSCPTCSTVRAAVGAVARRFGYPSVLMSKPPGRTAEP